MATLADLLALQPATLPRYEGTLAEALLGGWSGKGQALPPEFSDWASPMPGKRGISDFAGAFIPLEQNSAGERRLALPAVIKGLPQVPQALADLMQRASTGGYRPTVEDPMTGRMYDPSLYEDARTLAQIAMTGTMPIPAPLNSLRAFSVWHGTPHRFPAERRIQLPDGTKTHILASDPLPEGAKVLEELPLGRFRMDKIGTGEGAQAFGHGLYTAEEKAIGAGYRDNLAGVMQNTPHVSSVVDGWLADANGDFKAAANNAKQYLREFGDQMDREQFKEAQEAVRLLEKGKRSWGSLYKVEIDAEPEDFLDWDRKLAEQPEVAKKLGFSLRTSDEIHNEADALFAKYGQYPDMPPEIQQRLQELQNELDNRVPNLTGEQFYSGNSENDYLHARLSGQKYTEDHSAPLREKGIPGIRYYDNGSRATGGGELLGVTQGPGGYVARIKVNRSGVMMGGKPTDVITTSPPFKTAEEAKAWADSKIGGGSRNYVVFDDSLMKILLRE